MQRFCWAVRSVVLTLRASVSVASLSATRRAPPEAPNKRGLRGASPCLQGTPSPITCEALFKGVTWRGAGGRSEQSTEPESSRKVTGSEALRGFWHAAAFGTLTLYDLNQTQTPSKTIYIVLLLGPIRAIIYHDETP